MGGGQTRIDADRRVVGFLRRLEAAEAPQANAEAVEHMRISRSQGPGALQQRHRLLPPPLLVVDRSGEVQQRGVLDPLGQGLDGEGGGRRHALPPQRRIHLLQPLLATLGAGRDRGLAHRREPSTRHKASPRAALRLTGCQLLVRKMAWLSQRSVHGQGPIPSQPEGLGRHRRHLGGDRKDRADLDPRLRRARAHHL